MLDNDDPGRKASQELYEELKKQDIGCEIFDWDGYIEELGIKEPVKDMNELWMIINGRVKTNDRR